MPQARAIVRFLHLLNHDAQKGALYFSWPHKVGTQLRQLINTLTEVGAISHFERPTSASGPTLIFIKYRQGLPTAR